jgi:predicted metal-dependent phosphoesterase TrpH
MPAGVVYVKQPLRRSQAVTHDQHPLRAVLNSIGPDSCPGLLNFHCHTVCSDGSLEPVALIEQATARKLSHIAVTDHHSIAAYVPMVDWLDRARDRGECTPTLWSGMEISCILRGCLVHVLALGFRPGDPALLPYSSGDAAVGAPLRAGEVCKAIHLAGGLAILAHPGRYRLGFSVLIDAAAELGFDGGEAWYDYDMQQRWEPTPLICDSIDKQLKNLGLLRTCGTDTHGVDLKGR